MYFLFNIKSNDTWAVFVSVYDVIHVRVCWMGGCVSVYVLRVKTKTYRIIINCERDLRQSEDR